MAEQELLTNPDNQQTKDSVNVEPEKSSKEAPKFTASKRQPTIESNPEAIFTQRSLPSDVAFQYDHEKFEPYVGKFVNPITQDNLAELRAYKQSGWEAARRSLAQLALGEVVGGTIETVGYLGELFDTESTLYGGQDGFTNALVEIGQKLKEATRDKWEIYEANPGEFGGEGWFFSNAPTIGTMFALLGPSAVVTGAIKGGLQLAGRSIAKKGLQSMAKKAAKEAGEAGVKKIARKGVAFSKVPMNKKSAYKALMDTRTYEKAMPFTQAGISRFMEGQMEAQGFWEQKYEELMNTGNYSEEQAKMLASKGASDVFKKNWILMAQDVAQMKLFRGLFKTPGTQGVTKSGIANSDIARIGKDMIGEGLEEGFQYVIGEEADYLVDRAAGLVGERTLAERVRRYDGGELATSMFFGALGSGVMQGAGSIAGRYRKTIDNGIDPLSIVKDGAEPDKRGNIPANDPDSKSQVTKDFNMIDLMHKALNTTEDATISANVLNEALPNFVMGSIKKGVEESNRKAFESLFDMNDEQLAEVLGEPAKMDFSDEQVEMFKETWNIASEEFKKAEKFGDYADSIANSNAKSRIYKYQADKINEIVQEQVEAYPEYDKLTPKDYGQEILDLRIRKKALGRAKELSKVLTDKAKKEQIDKRIAQETNAVQKRLDRLTGKNKIEIDADLEQNRNRILKGSETLIKSVTAPKGRQIFNELLIEHYKDKADNLVKEYEKKSKQQQKEEEKQSKEAAKDPKKNKLMFGENTPDDLDSEGETTQTKETKKTDDSEKSRLVFSETPNDLFDDSPTQQEPTEKSDSEEASIKIPEINKDKLRVHPKGKKAEVGDFIRMNSDPDGQDLYYVANQKENGNYEVISYNNNNIKVEIPESSLETFSVIIEAGTKIEKDVPENEDGEAYEDVPDETNSLRTIKKDSIWTGAWLSSNNEWREDNRRESATQESDALTTYLENGAPIPEGTYGVAEVKSDVKDLEQLTDEDILDLDISLSLKNPDGTDVIESEQSVELPVHTPNYAENIAPIEGMTYEESIGEHLETLLKKKKRIVEELAKGNEVRVPITGKGTGMINFRKHDNNHPVRNNIEEVFGTTDIPLAVMDDVGDFVIGRELHPEFVEITGNPTQRGRVYTKMVTANGTQSPVPLDKAKLNSGEVDVAVELIKEIAKGKGNAQLEATVTNMTRNENRLSSLLDIFPEMTNMELFNYIVYESGKSVKSKANKQLHIDIKRRIITISKNKDDVEFFSFNDLNDPQELKEYLKTHYRNVSKLALTNDAYKEYLIANNIITAQFEAKDLFVQPVVYLGDPYPQEESIPHNEVKDTTENNDVESTDTDSFWGEDVSPDDEAPFQKSDLAGTIEGNIIPFVENLAIRTGWGYEMIDNSDIKWAGKVEGDKMIFNLAYASVNTAFHEYSHPIIRQIKKEKPLLYKRLLAEARTFDEFNIVTNAVRKSYPEYDNDQVLEESLVQLIGDMASNNIKTNGLKSVLHRIWNQILQFVQRLMPTTNIADLSLNTSLKDIANLLNSNSFIGVSTNPLFGFSKTIGSRKQFEDWTDLLMHSVIHRNNTDINEIQNPDELDFDVLKGVLSYYKNNAKTKSQVESINNVLNGIAKVENGKRIIDLDSPYIKTIKEKIRKFGTYNPLEGQEDLFTEEVPDDEKSRMRNVKDGYEINHKDKLSEDVKFMMNFIPKTNEDGSLAFKQDSGIMDFHSFNDIWNTLIKQLSDIEPAMRDGKREDLFEKYMSKIGEIATFRPEFNTLISRVRAKTNISISEIKDKSKFKNFYVQIHNPILEGSDKTFKERFVRAFNLVDQNFITVQSSVSYYKGYPYTHYRIIEKNPQSAEQQIIKQWNNNIIQNFIDYSDLNEPKVHKEYINYLESKRMEIRNAFANNRTSLPEALKTKMVSLLNEYGTPLNKRELNYYLQSGDVSERAMFKDLFNSMKRWNEDMLKISEVKQDTEWFTDTQSSSIKALAEAKGFFNQDLSDNNILGPDNKILYNYATPTMMHKYINEWKENPEHLVELSKHPFYRTSRWRDHILAGKNIQLMNNINYKSQYDKGNRPKDINVGDRIAQSLNTTLQGYFPLHARGSNATEYFIKGPEVIDAHIIYGDDLKVGISESSVDIMTDYLQDELNRIAHERQYVKDNPNDLIEGYHTYDSNIDGVPAFRIHMFPQLNNDASIFNKDGTPKENIRESLREKVGTLLNNEITETKQAFVNAKIFNVESTTNNALDAHIFSTYLNKFGNQRRAERFNKAVTAIATDYVINTMIANKEQQKLFSGDPALYKNQAELQKRILSSGSGGYSAYISPEMTEEIRSATIEDVKIASRHQEYFKQMGIDGFEKANIADGQSWITYDMFKRMLKSYGKWEPEFYQIDQIIKNRGDLPKAALRRFATMLASSNFSAQPLKTVGTELVTKRRKGMPKGIAPRFVYNKHSVLPIIPGYTDSSPQMRQIADIMDKYELDQLSAISGVKEGSLKPGKIHDDEGNILPTEEVELKPYTQSLRFTFLQQDLPKKGIGPILDPSQAKHNIYVDLVEGETYGGLQRKDVIAKLNNIQGALSNKGKAKLFKEISVDGEVSISKLNNKLADNMTQRRASRNLIQGLSEGAPIESMITHNIPIQNNLASIFNSATVKLKHSTGMAGIQISEFGFVNRFENLSADERDGIIWLKKDGLDPPMLDEDGVLHPGSILVPYHVYQKNPDILNEPDKLRQAMRGIDARIPNQALSNIGYFEVAGILPPEAGDSVVVYGEITNKTGSDFDIDKIILQFFNLDDSLNVIEYHGEENPSEEYLRNVYRDRQSYGDTPVKYEKGQYVNKFGKIVESAQDVYYSENEWVELHKNSSPFEYNSKQAIENEKLNTYVSILSNKEAYKRMMEILDSEKVRTALEKVSEGYKANMEYNVANRFNPLNGLFQVFTREIFIDANSAVGVVANHTVDHPQSQYAEIYLQEWNPKTKSYQPYKLGVGNVIDTPGGEATAVSKADNKDIAGYLKELMNAMVDAEKDPWAAIANMNLSTISSVITMFRIGLSPGFVSDIIRHDIVRKYIYAKREMGTTFTFSDKSTIQIALDNYNKSNNTNYTEEQLGEMKLNPNPQSDIEILKFYLKMESISSEITEGIRGSKFTVNGLGKNVFDAISMMKAKGNVKLGNFHQKFFNDGNKTMEQYFYENSIELFMETLGGKMLATSNGFMGQRVTEEHSSIGQEVYNGGLITMFETNMGLDMENADNIRAVYDGLLPYVLHDTINPDLNDLIGKENSVGKQTLQLKEEINNPLIDMLQVQLGIEYDLVSFPNAIKLSEEGRDQIEDAWLELFQNNKTREYAIRLAKYSYASSGFKFGINSFFQYMPFEINKELGIPDAIENAIIEGRDSTAFIDGYEQIMMNNADNQSLVPRARKKDYTSLGDNKLNLTSKKSKFENSPEFISIDNKGQVELYRRDIMAEEEGNIYNKTMTLGMQQDGFNFVEYNRVDEIRESYFSNLRRPKMQDAISEQRNTSKEQDSSSNKEQNDKQKFVMTNLQMKDFSDETASPESQVEPKITKKELSVDHYKIKLKDGVPVFKNGTPVESETIRNKFEVREAKQAGRFVGFTHSNKTDYAAIINFNGEFKIVSLSKTNTGGEVFKQGTPQREQILTEHPDILKLYKDYCKGA